MNFAIYCRKSKYTGRGESIENQVEYCKQYIELTFKGNVIAVYTYIDEGYSGKDLERPAFKHMLKDCYSNRIDYVVVYRLDRISRNVSDFANLYQELLDLNVGFISTSERYDTSTSGGRAMLLMACVFAQLERETVSERVKDNMYSLAKTGRWLGGITPTGYTSKPCYYGNKVKYQLCPNSNLSTVELIFKRYLDSHSTSKVEQYLYDANVKTPSGNYYGKSSIKTILENPVYCQSDRTSFEYLQSMGCGMYCTLEECNLNGYIVYGKTSTNGGKVQKRTPYSTWVVAIGEHKGIISGTDWVSVQSTLHSTDYRSRSVHNSNSLLSGILHCPLCHSKMVSRTKRNGFVYACSNKLYHGTKACNSKSIDGTLDSILVDELFNLVMPDANAVPLLESLKKGIHTGVADTLERTILDTNVNVKNILVDGFKAMPITVRRRFLQEVVYRCEVLY